MVEHVPEPKRFSPKIPVQLDPPKNDPISQEELAKCDGTLLPPPPSLSLNHTRNPLISWM
jgi:hypothetical protein